MEKWLKPLEKINLAHSIMLQSNLCVLKDTPPELKKEMGECSFDQGGYFIIDGQEKVCVSHERKRKTNFMVKHTRNILNTLLK